MSDTNMTREQAVEHARSLGMDYDEAYRYADGYLRGLPNRTADLTVKVKGQNYVIEGPLLDEIELERNRARMAGQRRQPSTESQTRRALRKTVMDEFKVNADTAALILAAVRRVRTDWKPEQLNLAVRWEQGWKLYEVTGTRHAYYLLRKLADREGFQGARLNDPLLRTDGYIVDNVITLSLDDITGSDVHGKYQALLDRNNAHYDLERDALRS